MRPSICSTMSAPAITLISRLNHTAHTFAVYASCNRLPIFHARLASGCWLTLPGGIGYPLGFNERFQLFHFPLSEAYPDAKSNPPRDTLVRWRRIVAEGAMALSSPPFKIKMTILSFRPYLKKLNVHAFEFSLRSLRPNSMSFKR